MFCRLRPFWVVKLRGKDRKTCMCNIHDNLQLKFKTAQNSDLIPNAKDTNSLIKEIVCNENDKACMYRECHVCKAKSLDLQIEEHK